MNHLPAILSFAACCTAGLLALSVVRARLSAQKVFFVLTMLVLSLTQGLQGLVLASDSPQRALMIFQIFLFFTLMVPAFALPLFHLFARKVSREELGRRLPGIAVLIVLLAASALLLPVELVVREIHFAETGLFWGLTLSEAGKALAVFSLIVNVFILYCIENTYRSATVPAKVALKYPMLGIIAASIVNFIVMSRILSISSLDRQFMALEACGIIILAASFIFAGRRYPLFDVQSVSRDERPSVLTLVISGLYLLSIALISYISAHSGLSFDRFGLYVLGIFIAFLVLAVGVSGRARRKLRRFLNENFYLERYNYRKEWRRYARLMASSSTIDDFLSNTISSLCETVMVRKGLIWVDIHGGKGVTYGLLGDEWDSDTVEKAKESAGEEPVVFLDRRRRGRGAAGADEGKGACGRNSWMEALAFLAYGDEPRGFIALGAKDTGTPYNEEDRDFLETVTGQAALTLENLIMEERFIESSQMESFNRFASFVIHDLKNTVGMLSLTAENARENFGDEEFQKDAIVTINRSVEKMRRLIDSLNAHKSPGAVHRRIFDAAELMRSTAGEMARIADSKKVALSVDPGNIGKVDADPAAIRRIIENLALNALEAAPEGGSVVVAAAPMPEGGFTISVSDSGPGFDPSYFENSLFKPFRSTKSNGLGIGLVLCKSLAEAHGGTISITNGPSGAVVTIFIPRDTVIPKRS